MMRSMRLAVALMAAAGAVFGAETFRIAGTAVDAVSGAPMKRARVVLGTNPENLKDLASAITGDDGRFSFDAPAGHYSLRLERRSLPPQFFGSPTLFGGFSAAVIAGPGQQTDELLLRVHPPSAISGKVVDDGGNNVEDALVQLVAERVVAGRKVAAMAGWTRTNDLGEFRFGHIPAGTYFLAVTGKPWYSQSLPSQAVEGSQTRPLAFAPVFYPNSSDPRAAAPIVLKAGQEFSANFTLVPTPGYSITVRLGTQDRRRSNRVIRIVGEGVKGTDLFSEVQNANGRTAFLRSVPPGRYTVRVNEGDRQVGSQAVEVASADVEMEMAIADPTTVSGTVALPAAAAAKRGRIFVVLHDETFNAGYTRPIGQDGSFTAPGVRPGTYGIHLGGERTVYAESVSVDEKLVAGGVLHVGAAGIQRVNVTAALSTARVKGLVERGGRPAPAVMVALAPVKPSGDHARYHGFMTDSDGSFDFEGVPPGDYMLIATEDLDLEYANPDAVERLRSTAKNVRVAASAVVEEKLEVPVEPQRADARP